MCLSSSATTCLGVRFSNCHSSPGSPPAAKATARQARESIPYCKKARSGGDGQGEAEGRASSRLARDPDLPAVRLDQSFGDVETQAEPVPGALAGLRAVVLFEQSGQIRRLNPRPLVRDGRDDLIAP